MPGDLAVAGNKSVFVKSRDFLRVREFLRIINDFKVDRKCLMWSLKNRTNFLWNIIIARHY